MATVTVEIDKKNDLPAIEAFLKKMGLEYKVETDEEDWGDLAQEVFNASRPVWPTAKRAAFIRTIK